MRLYYEANENVQDIETTPEFLRIDITDMTQVEKDAVLADIKDIMAGKDYQLVRHSCGHTEGKPCKVEVI